MVAATAWSGRVGFCGFMSYFKLIEESDRKVNCGGEVFGDVMVVAIVGVQVGDAACVADLPGRRHL